MYSPKIDEKLVPGLYRIAKARGIHMTSLINSIIADAIKDIKVESKMVVSESREVFVIAGEGSSLEQTEV